MFLPGQGVSRKARQAQGLLRPDSPGANHYSTEAFSLGTAVFEVLDEAFAVSDKGVKSKDVAFEAQYEADEA